jgi:hypothetical protein
VSWGIRALTLVLLAHVMAYLSSGQTRWALSGVSILALAFVAGVIGVLDIRMRHDELFLNSLGVSRMTVAAVWAAWVLLLESVVLVWA